MYIYAKKDNVIVIGELVSVIEDSVCLKDIHEVTLKSSFHEYLDLELFSRKIYPKTKEFQTFLTSDEVEVKKIEHKYYPGVNHFDGFIITTK